MTHIATKAAELGESEEDCLHRLLLEAEDGDNKSRDAFMEKVSRIIDRKYNFLVRKNPWLETIGEKGDFSNQVLINITERLAGIKAINGGASIRGYINSSCKNYFVSLLRQQRRALRLQMISADHVGRDNRVMELKACIREALGFLTPIERRIIKIKYQDSKTTLSEISEELGISYGYVRTIYPRALRKLAEHLNHPDWRKAFDTTVEPEDMNKST